MNTPIDNRLVDSYINQQIKFKNEEIRKKELANNRTNVANKALIIVALGDALGVAIYLALAGVGKAQSFEQTKKNINTTHTSIEGHDTDSVDSNSNIEVISEDELIDVDSLIKEDNKFKDINKSTPVPDQNVVRDYVIFDRHDINEGNVSRLWVGRKYIDENASSASSSWCYVDLNGSGGIRERVDLVNIENGKRTAINFTSNILNRMGISLTRANQLVKKCGI